MSVIELSSISKHYLMGQQLILATVLTAQPPPQEDNDNDKQDVAAHVDGKGNEVSRFIPV